MLPLLNQCNSREKIRGQHLSKRECLGQDYPGKCKYSVNVQLINNYKRRKVIAKVVSMPVLGTLLEIVLENLIPTLLQEKSCQSFLKRFNVDAYAL